ncbi:MAG TPA: glycosyltransferase family 2 protein [Planctomycetota bacterium]|jgi:glycosyltransferase involved in cell wall biosynthesis|nr:glycosyltransferase family 2 protein [Planctomycetota bacterium]
MLPAIDHRADSAHRALLAVIPAYNEAARIAPVVRQLVTQGLPVLVVDDGSRDTTAQVAREAGAKVLRRANGGKGTAIIAGCRHAVELGYRRVLLLDGDGQHDPAEASRLIAAAQRGADLVIGMRMLDLGRQPLYRRYLNRLSSMLVTMAAGQRIRDSQSGYRMCDPRLLLSLPLAGHKYDLETEMCILAARAGRRVVEVPIRVIYNDKVSGVHPLYDTLRFFRAVAMSLTRCRCGHRLAPSPPFVLPTTAPRMSDPAPVFRLASAAG